ncbi:hypothetical protein BTJ39_23780 [Izhakiella australiensis]|uniref:Uncharacterized protein n=1 Tax=Izhakiella australiensis TaxID=1926881 RepID=A0A1S8Y6G5_9GAMM|nr:hypothetical protein [Izhakiella australiensis]OON34640.1 hypothetical protein BTJ39_23780 [Izhakiella australiensis]
MEHAKTRKKSSIAFTGRHLLSTAHQALMNTRQTVVARLLDVADSTIMHRTKKYPEIMETLAACGVEDFVLRGEKKLPLDQYRWLMTVAMEFARLQLEITSQDESFSA